jgi:ABC-type phosphate transport system substrate-binding protein
MLLMLLCQTHALGVSVDGGGQVLDGETLGRIWTGNITHWDDPAIASRNGVVDLPHQPIILCYGSPGIADFFLVNNISFPTSESVSETFKRGMSELSSRFAGELARLNGSFTNMAPFAEGRGFTGSNSTTRLAFVRVRCSRLVSIVRLYQLANTRAHTQAHPYSLTYSDLATATATQAVMARMVNKAGATVRPTVASIQSAMEDFQTTLLRNGATPSCTEIRRAVIGS